MSLGLNQRSWILHERTDASDFAISALARCEGAVVRLEGVLTRLACLSDTSLCSERRLSGPAHKATASLRHGERHEAPPLSDSRSSSFPITQLLS